MLIAGIPVRLASAAPRTFAWSAVSVPEGSSTSGASSGGAGAGIVGQAITSTSAKRAARRRRISVRTRCAWAVAAAGSSIRYLSVPRAIGLSSGLSRLSFSGVASAMPPS